MGACTRIYKTAPELDVSVRISAAHHEPRREQAINLLFTPDHKARIVLFKPRWGLKKTLDLCSVGPALRLTALASSLMVAAAWAGPALEGVYSGRDLGQLSLSTGPGGDVLGKAKKGGACSFRSDSTVLEGSWQGDLLVGHLTVCQSGAGCPSERRVPFLALWHLGTLVADIKLAPGCRSPAFPDNRLELQPASADDRTGEHKSGTAEQVAKKAMTEKEREAFLQKLLQQGVDQLNHQEWTGAKRTFTAAMEDGADNSLVYMGLGVAEVRLGDSTRGIEQLVHSIQLAKQEKNNAVLGQAHFNLACAYATQNKPTEVLSNLKLAAKLIPARDLEGMLDGEHDLDPLKETTEYRQFAGQVHLDAAKPVKKK